MQEMMVSHFGLDIDRPHSWPWMSYVTHGDNVLFFLQNFPAADHHAAEVWPERGGGCRMRRIKMEEEEDETQHGLGFLRAQWLQDFGSRRSIA